MRAWPVIDWDSAHRGPRTVWICECCERRNVRQEPDGDDTCECTECESCGEGVREGEECENEECPSTCPHSDRDEYCCLICGAEMGELDACRAEAAFEGDR